MDNQTILSIRDLRVVFEDGFTALGGVSIDIGENEFVTLLGPSGCGKTTLLRCIGGFEKPTGGEILYKGQNIIGLPPYKRAINTVFQRYALFPHLNVAQNVAFGPDLRKEDKKKTAEEVSRMLALVGLAGFEKRRISSLSGGQQQRVAIARALINKPDVLLLDEPLGALDLKLRREMQLELKRIQRESGITFIFVTHDQEEALTLSDRIAVFNKGYIEQIGTPNEIYNHSKTEFVCNFIGDINRVEAPIAAKMKLAAGQNHFIRLERLHVNKPKRDDEILIDGVVENIEYYGLYIKYYIDVGSQILKAIEKNDGINIYAPGEKVTVAMKPTDVMSYDAQ